MAALNTRLGVFYAAIVIGGLVLPAPAIAQDAPELTADEVMVDLSMQGFLGISLADEDLTPLLVDPTVSGMFGVPEVDPPLRTSFYAETLDELGMESDLGPPPPLTGVATAWLTFTEPVADPQALVFTQYAPMADIAFPPDSVSGIPARDMLAVAVQIDADITDPAVCSGMQLDLVVAINNPAWGDPYVASPSFPGEYYQGGNFFPTFGQYDCEQETFADTYLDHEVVSGLGNSGAALFTVGDGVTNGVILLSAETINADASVRVILFEHHLGETFTPANTRYQSWPDIFDPALSIGDGITKSADDFGLVPAGPAPVEPTTTTQPALVDTTQPAIVDTTQPAVAPPTQVAAVPDTEPAVAPPDEQATTSSDDESLVVPITVTAVGLLIAGAGTWLAFGQKKEGDQVVDAPELSSGGDAESPSVAPPDRPGKGIDAGAKPPPRIGIGTRIAQSTWIGIGIAGAALTGGRFLLVALGG